MSERFLVFFESIHAIVTEFTEDISLLFNESLKFLKESDFFVSSLSRVFVFSGESRAHFDSMFKSFTVSFGFSLSGRGHGFFSLNADIQLVNVVSQISKGSIEIVEDYIVGSNTGVVVI